MIKFRILSAVLVLFASAASPRAEEPRPLSPDAGAASPARSVPPVAQPAPPELPAPAWVAVPVVDLRAEPGSVPDTASLRRPYAADPLQESQLLYAEKVLVVEEKGPWAKVEAVEQPEFSHKEKWEGYPGWVPKETLVFDVFVPAANAVVRVPYAKLHDRPRRRGRFMKIPLGSKLRVLHQDYDWVRVQRPGDLDGWIRLRDIQLLDKLPSTEIFLRGSVVKTARLFLGQPYYWGGRSPHRSDEAKRPSGVDCSSLVNLAYRVHGIDIPRDAHEQYLKSRPVTLNQLKPGDLVFLAKPENPNAIVHVMMYAGGENVIEAVEQYDTVREVTLKKKLGVEFQDLWPGERTGEGGRPVTLDRYVYFGRFLPD